MEVLFLLIPMSLVLVALIGAAFTWSVRSGQYDDLEGPAHRILADDDGAPSPDGGEGAAALTPVNPAPGAAGTMHGIPEAGGSGSRDPSASSTMSR
jgi:cbb3-type cytochrome oxidase maturation protein